jgi:hypothetical protein
MPYLWWYDPSHHHQYVLHACLTQRLQQRRNQRPATTQPQVITHMRRGCSAELHKALKPQFSTSEELPTTQAARKDHAMHRANSKCIAFHTADDMRPWQSRVIAATIMVALYNTAHHSLARNSAQHLGC